MPLYQRIETLLKDNQVEYNKKYNGPCIFLEKGNNLEELNEILGSVFEVDLEESVGKLVINEDLMETDLKVTGQQKTSKNEFEDDIDQL